MIIKLVYRIKMYIEVRNICEIIANYPKMKISKKLKREVQPMVKWKIKKKLIYKMH